MPETGTSRAIVEPTGINSTLVLFRLKHRHDRNRISVVDDVSPAREFYHGLRRTAARSSLAADRTTIEEK
jgi:hypothetical protein